MILTTIADHYYRVRAGDANVRDPFQAATQAGHDTVKERGMSAMSPSMRSEEHYPGIHRRQASALLNRSWFTVLLLLTVYFSPILINPVYAQTSPFPPTTYYNTRADACAAWESASPVVVEGPPGVFSSGNVGGYGIIPAGTTCDNSSFMGWGYIRNYYWCGGVPCYFGGGLSTGSGVAEGTVNFDIVACPEGSAHTDPTSSACNLPTDKGNGDSCSGGGGGGGGDSGGGGGGGGGDLLGPYKGDPCNTATGNEYQIAVDITSPEPETRFTRYYNSNLAQDAGFGFGWTNSVSASLNSGLIPGQLVIQRFNGRSELFVKQADGTWQGDPDTRLQLVQDNTGYTLSLQTGATERYDLIGRLISRATPAGLITNYAYTNGKLTGVMGPFGHTLALSYDPNGHLTQVTDSLGQTTHYAYDSNNNLTQVTYPDGGVKGYLYENTSFPHALTGIVDEMGSRFATIGYDAQGRANLTQHAATTNNAPQERFTFSYDSITQTTVTDPVGTGSVETFIQQLGLKQITQSVNQQDGKRATARYDNQNNRVSRTNEEGQTTTYTYNATNQLTGRSDASGAPEARTTTYQYLSPTLSLPTLIQSPSVYPGNQRQTSISYQNNNPVTITQSGYRPDGTPISRTVSMQYNSAGQVIQIDGPRTDVLDITTLDYYPCTLGSECGQLKSVTNALGQLTQYNTYNADGRLTQLTDANGVVTQYTYDTRGRVATLTQTPPGGLSRTTTYFYDNAGQLLQTQLPNGVTLSYTYDAAHYLRSVVDNAGNRVEYAYDLKGNRTQETSKDPDGTVVRAVTLSYDIRNRVAAINAGGSLTQQIHDALGNLISEIDPNNASSAGPATTSHSYDTLNRLIQTFDRLGNPVAYSYDVNDKPIQIIPSNGISTRHVYDDLGNLLQEQSPTRGTITYTYNEAGQVISRTEADGTRVAYAYDALGRLTQISYPGVADNVSYFYDGATCSFGIGKLCTVIDASGTTGYAYDGFGNRTQETKTELGISYTTQYTYDAGNQLTAITYPDGRIVSYTRDSVGRVTQIAQTVSGITTSLLSAITPRADGLIKAQTFGNGLTETRAYDLQGRLTSQNVGTLASLSYTYDANGNLLTLPAATYGYDLMDRLLQVALGTESNSYTYEGNGDILYKTSTNPTPPPRDDAFSYNAPGQLSQYLQAGVVKGNYVYDYRNLRTRKTATSGTTIYHYDQQGNLLVETQADGSLIRAYVWLNTTPIAQLDRNGTTETISYLHTDHLNTPRFATNSLGIEVWSWDSDGFGTSLPNEDPDADGILTTVNLRFPGQYFDQETGLHYNWNRYYDPRTGRYITADPVSVGEHVEGMLARMNTPRLLRSVGVTLTPDVNQPPLEINPYAYIANNPLRWADLTGESIGWPGVIVIVGGACFTAYCAIQAKNYCEAAYPSSGGPENDRKRVKCASERLWFCVTFGMYIMDPIGSGAATIGEEVGKKTCKECEH